MAGGLTLRFARLFVTALLAAATLGAGCSRPAEAPRLYTLRGQVLAVHEDRQQLTVKHEDIEGFMPGMTMSFPVSSPDLLKGRKPGELIEATLEVTDTVGRLTAVKRTGFLELPSDTNAVAMAGNLLEVGDEIPDTAFIDQQDRRRSISEWRGAPMLLTFIYTRCPLPNFCPLMDRHFAALQRAIGEDAALRGRVKLVTVSFDPEYDTPKVLAAHAGTLKADPGVWTFLTGDRPTVDRFAARLGVGLVRPAGAAEITHNLRTVLVGADGRILHIYSGNEWTPARALEDIRAAVRVP